MLIQERDLEILLWLVHMSFSNLDQIRKVFFKNALNSLRSPYRRLLKLIKTGLIKTVKVYSDPHDLYIATRPALALLKSSGFECVPALPKDKRFLHFDHDNGLIELRILALELDLGIWVPERMIRSVKPRGHSPDALLMTLDANYAVEYELHPKEPYQRYEKIFERYDSQRNYDGVLYILPSESRINTLREKLGYIQKKIYFISKETLFQEKENAVFYSSGDGLPVKRLIDRSRTGSVQELDPGEIKEILESEDSDDWKDRKPFVPYGGGRHRDRDDNNEGESGRSDHFGYDPSDFPNRANQNSDEDED